MRPAQFQAGSLEHRGFERSVDEVFREAHPGQDIRAHRPRSGEESAVPVRVQQVEGVDLPPPPCPGVRPHEDRVTRGAKEQVGRMDKGRANQPAPLYQKRAAVAHLP